MTEQRIFPFMVNGQFWREIEVDDKILKYGRMVVPVRTETDSALYDVSDPNPTAIVKHVVFQLAELGESKNNYVARWFHGFWVVDDSLYLKDEKLYLKQT